MFEIYESTTWIKVNTVVLNCHAFSIQAGNILFYFALQSLALIIH